MKDKNKIIQLELFKKSNNLGSTKLTTITSEEMYMREINELQKNLYNAYDRITELREEIRKLKSSKTNKE
jgi:predicted RNase H-like nuclease (RuvC/YqgF family)